jgi:DNA polymerase-4
LANVIFAEGRDMLQNETGVTRYRLIGIGVSNLVETQGDEIADMLNRRGAQAEQAIDKLRARFGSDAVVRGLTIDVEDVQQHSPSTHLNLDPRVRGGRRS